MNKYTKHKSFTALVLEIRASLYLTDSGAIFTSKFCQFSETEELGGDEEGARGGRGSFTETVILNLLIPSCLVTGENKFLRICEDN